jgi:hypothetical protein
MVTPARVTGVVAMRRTASRGCPTCAGSWSRITGQNDAPDDDGGARPQDVAKLTIYVVDYRLDDHYTIIEAARVTLFGDHKPANVVLGVATLSPGYLIEVDAFAVAGG